MRNYMWYVKALETHLSNLQIHRDGKSIEGDLVRLFQDLRDIEKFEYELTDEQREVVVRVHQKLADLFKLPNYKEELLKDKFNKSDFLKYISAVAAFFEERYKIVNGSPTLRKIYRKGLEMSFKKKIDVFPVNYTVPSPCILASTHDLAIEPSILPLLTDKHIHWVGDMYLYIPQSSKIYNWPIIQKIINTRLHNFKPVKGILDKLGILEVDRLDKSSEATQQMPEKALHVLEKGGIVGIFPLGSVWEDRAKWKQDPSGVVIMAMYAQKNLKKKVPIIPVGVRKENKRIIVNFGEPIIVEPVFSKGYREQMGFYILKTIYQLAGKSITLEEINYQ